MEFIRTNEKNVDFMENCRLLDRELHRQIGNEIQPEMYDMINCIEGIGQVILVYEEGDCIGGGALKGYNETDVELKRIFVHTDRQGRGVGKELILHLLEWAKELGYHRVILETGESLAAARAVYKKIGFKRIANYEPYVGMEESICMSVNV